jgi:hypothetical protein
MLCNTRKMTNMNIKQMNSSHLFVCDPMLRLLMWVAFTSGILSPTTATVPASSYIFVPSIRKEQLSLIPHQ